LTEVYLGLGSNLGDRLAHLLHGVDLLGGEGLVVNEVSSVYETEPVECRDSLSFLNCVVRAATDFSPPALLERILDIEDRLGRRRPYPNAPRPLDIDILIMGDLVLHSPRLEIPHPRLTVRRFVLTPLAEIAPRLRHPVSRITMACLLEKCMDTHAVKFYCKWPGPPV
jgi:2-amino-4-hydroxy-6-hydroxymethyldihydropteridine diphosphokinase